MNANQLFRSSINTEYNDEQPSKSYLYRVPSFATSHRLSNQDIYTHRLQALIKQNSKTIKANKPLIEQLQCRRRFFKRICEKQKQKLHQINPNILRQEYEQELKSLRQARSKMHQMLTKLHQEAEEKQVNFQEITHCLSKNKLFLEESLIQIEGENSEIEQILRKKREVLVNQMQKCKLNAQIIVEKQRIEQKYTLIRQQIKRRQLSSQLH